MSDNDRSMLVQDITRKTVEEFIHGKMHSDYEMIRRVIGDDETPVVLLQHVTMICGLSGSMFNYLAHIEDEIPEDILKGLLLAITEAAARHFHEEIKRQKEEAT